MDWNAVPDWISATAAIVTAYVAADFGLRTFRQQRTTTDLELANAIFQEINRYWDRISDAGTENRQSYVYNVGQILVQFELAASLFNNKKLGPSALPILKDHIIEVFTNFQTSDEGKELIDACRSGPETFVELKKFCKAHMPSALRFLTFREERQGAGSKL